MLTKSRMSTVLGIIIVMWASGCGGGDDIAEDGTTDSSTADVNETQCEEAPSAATSSIASGMENGATLGTPAYVVETDEDDQNSSGWPQTIYAAPIADSDSGEEIGTWAMGAADTGDGPIWALNEPAQEWSTWGTAIQAGSLADDNRTSLAESEATASVEACVSENLAPYLTSMVAYPGGGCFVGRILTNGVR